jgi:hypothetical protein
VLENGTQLFALLWSSDGLTGVPGLHDKLPYTLDFYRIRLIVELLLQRLVFGH